METDLQNRGETLALSQQENAVLLERTTRLESTRGLFEGTQQAFVMTIKKKDDMLRNLQAALQAAIADGNDMQSDVAELKRQRKANQAVVTALEQDRTETMAQLSEKNAALKELEDIVRSHAEELSKATLAQSRPKSSTEKQSEEQFGALEKDLAENVRQKVAMASSDSESSRLVDELEGFQVKLADSEKRSGHVAMELIGSRGAFLRSEKQAVSELERKRTGVVNCSKEAEGLVAQLDEQSNILRVLEYGNVSIFYRGWVFCCCLSIDWLIST